MPSIRESSGVFRKSVLLIAICILVATESALGQTPVVPPAPPHQAPPPAPPSEFRAPAKIATPPESARGTILYSIGQPSDEEQLYLEYINRSRANPPAEGVRLATTTDADVLSAYSYFSVDLALMQSQFNAIAAAPPLAFNSELIAAARVHSQDMFTNQYQDHTGTDGSTPGTRMTAQGYSWSGYGENIFAYSKSTFYGHAGLNVDWGTGTGGMQTPPGHRVNMHNPAYREVGIGVVDGVNGSVGPQIVTQDFGIQQTTSPFITGVVYFDFGGTHFYDLGEGIGGVTIGIDGVSYYTVSADSGGYAVPVPGNGLYTVTFSAAGLASTQQVSIISGKNAKLDLPAPYSPPVISGPSQASVNQDNSYSFTPVAGASAYQWQLAQLTNYTVVEGAESGVGGVTISNSPGYSVRTNGVAASGSYSFHLAHPAPPGPQIIALNAVLRPQAASQLVFDKRLAYSASDEVARAQISTNGGLTWQDVWTQAGSNGSGEASFTHVTVSLASCAGTLLQVRFVYDYSSGSYFPQTSSGVGLYLDNIALTQAQQVLNPVVSNIPSGTSFTLHPSTLGTNLLSVRALVKSRTLNWGPALTVAAASVPSIQLAQTPVISGGQIKIDFTVANYRTNMTFQLWKAPDPSGPWTLDSAAATTTLAAGSKFRLTTSVGSALATCYRVLGM